MQFVVFERFYKCLLHQIAGEIMLLLVTNLRVKTSQQGRQILTFFLLFALVVSQSETRSFLMFIIMS